MTPYKQAVDKFMGSPEWETLSEPRSLRAPPEVRQYLENRLKRAFEAGWNARLSADCDEIAKRRGLPGGSTARHP